MKTTKAPLETRYKDLSLKATCRNANCDAGFEEISGTDLHIHEAGIFTRLSFTCPYCKTENVVEFNDIKDDSLYHYIINKNR